MPHDEKAATFSAQELSLRTMERRAVDAVIWGIPIVSFDVMRQVFLRAGRPRPLERSL
jgi:hypothetical protein